MKKLLVLFFVLAMCWPCYGEVLVYKTNSKETSVAFNSLVDNYGAYVEVKTCGFLLLDVDIDSFNRRISWINSAWCISLSGKVMDSWGLKDVEALYGWYSPAKTSMTISSFSIFRGKYDLADPNENRGFGDTFMARGVVKGTSLIKGGAKASIPAALNGFCHTDELLANKRYLGTTTISATLDKKWTARANDLSDLGGEHAIYNTFWAICYYLVAKGYLPGETFTLGVEGYPPLN
ncbi:MAG: hypothetical protein WC454_06465 [Phycisphaerae bacterium]|jgi:hypothetical protein